MDETNNEIGGNLDSEGGSDRRFISFRCRRWRPRKLLGNNTERLLTEEFSWNPEDLTADLVVGPPVHIDVEMVVEAITKKKTGKSAGPSGIVAEMLKASGDTGARLVADLANDMVRNGVIPSERER